MRLKELKNVLQADMVKIYVKADDTEQCFIREKDNEGEYVSLDKESLNMWLMYGEYKVKEIYVEDETLIVKI